MVINVEAVTRNQGFVQRRKRGHNRFMLRRLTGWGTYEAVIVNAANKALRRCTMAQDDLNTLAAWLEKHRTDVSKTSIPTDAQVDRWIESKHEKLTKEKQL